MSQFLHNKDDAIAIAIPQVSCKNSRAKNVASRLQNTKAQIGYFVFRLAIDLSQR